MIRFACICLLSMLVSACASMPNGSHSTDGITEALFRDNVDRYWLAYADNVGRQGAEAQKRELAELHTHKGDIRSSIKIALIYGMPNSALRDPAKAAPMINELLGRNLHIAPRTLLSLLRDHLAERERLLTRADGLQQKLNELREIDNTMIKRDRSK